MTVLGDGLEVIYFSFSFLNPKNTSVWMHVFRTIKCQKWSRDQH